MSQTDQNIRMDEAPAGSVRNDQGNHRSDGASDAITSISREFWTPEQLAAGLNVSLRTLRQWHRLRTGPARTSTGGVRLYRKVTVENWLKACEEPEVTRKRRP